MFRRLLLILGLMVAPMFLMGVSTCGSSGNDDDTTGASSPTPVPTATPVPPGKCSTTVECTNGQLCVSPGDSPGCGMCMLVEDQCAESKDCTQPGDVCALYTAPCLCNGPAHVCQPACTSTSCVEGDECGIDGLCHTISCTTGTFTCPALTSCVGGSGGNDCQRWTCSVDKDCGSGNACVNGQCFDSYGTCSYPPPRPASTGRTAGKQGAR